MTARTKTEKEQQIPRLRLSVEEELSVAHDLFFAVGVA
jgi:hypothetical protein